MMPIKSLLKAQFELTHTHKRMFWLWLSKVFSGMAGQRGNTLISSAWPYPTSRLSECSKEDGKGGPRPMCPNVSSSQKRGFLSSHIVYSHVCLYIKPRKSLRSCLGPVTTLVWLILMEAHIVRGRSHFLKKGPRQIIPTSPLNRTLLELSKSTEPITVS